MSEKNIYQRLAGVMATVAYVQKENKKVNNQYTFVSHDAVTAKLRPALIDNGIMPIVTVRDSVQDGNMTKVTIRVTFVNIDKPEERVEVESFGYGIDPQDKGPGKAVSYAFKYALLKTFCLETGDDPERDNIPHEPQGISADDFHWFKESIVEADSMDALLKIGDSIGKSKVSEQQRAELLQEFSKRKREIKAAVPA